MKSSHALIAMVALLLALMSVCTAQDIECGPNEYPDVCGIVCEETCDELALLCPMNCVDRCFCLPGYVREVEGGRCIPFEECALDNSEE